jgi:ABC-type glycerol-3-phosphate transport system substrate-binding protein
VADTLEFFDRLRREGLLSPDSFSKTPEQKREEFASGRTGMMIAPVGDIAPLRQKMGAAPGGGDPFGVTVIPGPESAAGKSVFGLGGWYAGVSARSKSPREAWAFVSFLEEKAPLLAAASRAVPGAGTDPGSYIREDPLYGKIWDMYEGSRTVREFDGVPRFRDLEALFRAEFSGLLSGNRSPAETATAIQQGWALILNPGG